MILCSACEKEKSPNEFHLDNGNHRGRQYVCKQCKGPIAVAGTRKWRKNNPIANMLRAAKERAKKFGVPFDLKVEDIFVPKQCPILGIKLERSKSRVSPNSPSLDKHVPSRGYVKGNVSVISMKANIMKNNATPKELVKFAEWIQITYGT